jgi:hypothetical protein
MHSLGSISAIASEKKIFLYFPDMVLRWQPSWISDRDKKQRTFQWSLLSSLVSEKKRFETFFPKGPMLNKSCRSRHFEFHIRTKNVKFVEDHPMNIHVQFGFNHICSFWEEGIWTFPIGSNANLCPAMVAILDIRSA